MKRLILFLLSAFCLLPAAFGQVAGGVPVFSGPSGAGSAVITTNEFDASAIVSGTVSDDRLPATISSDITGNAATATTATTATTANNITAGATLNPVNISGVTNQMPETLVGEFPWTYKALRTGKPVMIVFLGDSVMGVSGLLHENSLLPDALLKTFGRNGGFSTYAAAQLFATTAGGGSYRTNISGTHDGPAAPWSYWVMPAAGGIIYGQPASTPNLPFGSANMVHVTWVVNASAGNLLIKTRGAPGFSPTTTHWTVPMNVGTPGTLAWTNAPIATGNYQLMLEHSGGSSAAEIVNLGYWDTNRGGILMGQFTQGGRNDWDNWSTPYLAGVAGFQPTMVIAMEKNDNAGYAGFLSLNAQLKAAWTNADWVIMGNQPDPNDTVNQERFINNIASRNWASTNDAYYYEGQAFASTNGLYATGFTTDGTHSTYLANDYLFGRFFQRVGLLGHGFKGVVTNFVDWSVGSVGSGSGYWLGSNTLSALPSAPRWYGDSYQFNSNGFVFIMTSGVGSTWTATNKIAP